MWLNYRSGLVKSQFSKTIKILQVVKFKKNLYNKFVRILYTEYLLKGGVGHVRKILSTDVGKTHGKVAIS